MSKRFAHPTGASEAQRAGDGDDSGDGGGGLDDNAPRLHRRTTPRSATASNRSLVRALLHQVSAAQWIEVMKQTESRYDVVPNDSGTGENVRLDKKGSYLRIINELRTVTTDGADTWVLLMDGANLVQSRELRRHFPRLNLVVPARYTFCDSSDANEVHGVGVHVLNLRLDEVLRHSTPAVPWTAIVMDYNGTFLGRATEPTTPQGDLAGLIAAADDFAPGCLLAITVCTGRHRDRTDEQTLRAIRHTFARTTYRLQKPQPEPYNGNGGAHMLFLCGRLEKRAV